MARKGKGWGRKVLRKFGSEFVGKNGRESSSDVF